MAQKTVKISDACNEELKQLQKYHKKDSLLPVDFSQRESAEIAISRDLKLMQKKHGKLES